MTPSPFPLRVRPALLCALVAALPALARAQVSVAFTPDDPTLQSLSRGDCLLSPQPGIGVRWTEEPVFDGQSDDLFISDGTDCADGLSDLASAESQQTSAFPPAANAAAAPTPAGLFALAAPGTECGGPAGVSTTLHLCLRVSVPATALSAASTQIFSKPYRLDSVAPPAPTKATAESLDGGLRVSWEMPDAVSDTAGFRVYVSGTDGSVVEEEDISGASARQTDIEGLTNGTAYTVEVTALDSAGSAVRGTLGNESARSPKATGTPQPVEDFFQRYRRLGGTETGGCGAAGGAGLLAVLGLLPALARRRRRASRRALAGLALAALAVPGLARAQTPPPATDLASIVEQSRSPQHFSFEVRLGPYRPDVDAEFAGAATPFKDIYGSASPIMGRLELAYNPFDRILGRHLGLLQVGFSGGFWQASGKARRQDDTSALDSVLFNLWPLTPLLAYRADFLWREWQIPLVPFAKLGWGFVHWACKRETNNAVCKADGIEGQGWAQGLEYALGVQLMLDVFEPDKATALDMDYGINSTALFFQWNGRDWKGAHGLRLDGTAFEGGLAFFF